MKGCQRYPHYIISYQRKSAFCWGGGWGIPELGGHLKEPEIDLVESKDSSVLNVLTFTAEWDFIVTLQYQPVSL